MRQLKSRYRKNHNPHPSEPPFLPVWRRLRREHGNRVLLIVCDGVATAFLQDADVVGTAFGFDRLTSREYGPARGMRSIAFPAAVLSRNKRLLEKMGHRVAVVYYQIPRSNYHRVEPQTEPFYLPTPEEIASGAAEIRDSWDSDTERERAGCFAVQPATGAHGGKARWFFGRPANDR